MNILTIDDFLELITDRHLKEITSSDEDEQLAILDSAEIKALGECTGYISIRYDETKAFDRTKIDEFPGIATLIEKLADIAIYKLHAKAAPKNVPEVRQLRYDSAIQWLEKVADGFIAPQLPTKENEPTTPLRFGSSQAPLNPYY